MAVHPRWRGEHSVPASAAALCAGSSPLARGTHAVSGILAKNKRFIPAGAGNTCGCGWHSSSNAVHPRWRGEHGWAQFDRDLADGSSPLARGTLATPTKASRLRRFIPAGAGNTQQVAHPMPSATVHPRWRGEHFPSARFQRSNCGSSPLARGTRRLGGVAESGQPVHPRWRGEHFPGVRNTTGACGSSPLARGTPTAYRPLSERTRFIPAGAGNTAYMDSHSDCDGGSSPLARGTRAGVLGRSCRLRFIPAGAGNTGPRTLRGVTPTVHPRWRGEHISFPICSTCKGGSSPLARGTRIPALTQPREIRFIPAGAGNTFPVIFHLAMEPVHPRWRGEHAVCVWNATLRRGSSPLARGTRADIPRSPGLRWFIPAGAGNTPANPLR